MLKNMNEKESIMQAAQQEYEDFVQKRPEEEKRLINELMNQESQTFIFSDVTYICDSLLREEQALKEKTLEKKAEYEQSARQCEQAHINFNKATAKQEGTEALVQRGKAIEKKEALRREDNPE